MDLNTLATTDVVRLVMLCSGQKPVKRALSCGNPGLLKTAG